MEDGGPAMNPLEAYLHEMAAIRASGQAVKETSYYGPLSNFLNEIGKTLKPKVRCIIHIKNEGAGIPDGGFFTAEQLKQVSDTEPLAGPLPGRGAIEVKSPSEDAWNVAGSEQVAKYCKRYGQVLVTTYRDFVLVSQTADGKVDKLENYVLARKETDFWKATVHPQKTAAKHGAPLIEYLKRVMLHPAPLAEPKDVAWFLASYARDALGRIEHASLPALDALRVALEEALGLRFEGEKGDHFFRSTLIQTLFYGVFSAWVLWSKEHPPGTSSPPFAWQMAAWSLRVPMIKALFEQIALPTKLAPLNLVELLDWTAATLNRVERPQFFQKFQEAHAVQYFYEPFLEAFDPRLRKELGVWYTPDEVVRYMVSRVDTVLREDLSISDGLADPRVYVLDPCCGTGTFLVEVLKRIEQTLKEQQGDALVGNDLKKAAQQRVFGFEILPAPFVVSHLQLGLLLQNLGAPLADNGSERIGVYLTNSLTGWEPPSEQAKARLAQLQFTFAEFRQEHDAAEEIKREKPILVIIGNPPYNAFAGVSPAEEEGLVEPYKKGLNKPVKDGGWGIKKFNLDDPYIRFFRIAERRIVDGSGKGIACFVSNFSYLGDPSFVVMRERFMREFDSIWLDCMNGASRETGKLTPEGEPDPSIFSTEYNRQGIRVGTAIGLLVRRADRRKDPTILSRNFWGATKRADLLNSLTVREFSSQYGPVRPTRTNYYSFLPLNVSKAYESWPSIDSLCQVAPILGVLEKRRSALCGIERDDVERTMRRYGDKKVSWESLAQEGTGLTADAARFDAKGTRSKVIAAGGFDDTAIRRLMVRPMDVRWCYYSPIRQLWNEPRPTLVEQCWTDNAFLVCRNKAVAAKEGVPFHFTTVLGDEHAFHKDAYYIPIMLRPPRAKRGDVSQGSLLSVDSAPSANLSPASWRYLTALGVRRQEGDRETAELVWMHALAVGYSPRYLAENADGVRIRWPRIPLPATLEILQSSARLGRSVAAILDTESPVPGVTTADLRPDLRTIAAVSRVGGGQLETASHLALTVAWGHRGKDQVVMPGRGKIVERGYKADELTTIQKGATAINLSAEQALLHLGEKTCDVYLNNDAYWRNVPLKVWEYTIGGYQVIKKWLSYREHDILGRALHAEEAREVTNIARRIAALLLLEPALDANYEAVKRSAFPWAPSSSGSGK